MDGAIFLSASVPDPRRAPNYAKTADTVAITAAVSALVHVTLGRRRLVWGGHPAITPMICVVAEDIGVDYGRWVSLYQSKYFQDEFPDDNAKFQNVTYTEKVDNDREKSLAAMREQMLADTQFEAAVFIGGMGGIVQEFDLFCAKQADARIVPVRSTGGAVLDLKCEVGWNADLTHDLDYVALFHRHLDISVREDRFRTPSEQPTTKKDRWWRPGVN